LKSASTPLRSIKLDPMKRLDALNIAQSAFAEGEARGVVNMSVVITDPGGHTKLAMRSDTQGIFGVDTATAKAVTALGFNRSTLALGPLFTPQATVGVAAAHRGRVAPLGGGVVITSKDGVILGAAAVSGGLPEIDHEIIIAALKAHYFNTLP
jgi:uncharacterized protein GlcG (DUF336 family)